MNHIWTDICTRTNLLEYASEDLDYLNGHFFNQKLTNLIRANERFSLIKFIKRKK